MSRYTKISLGCKIVRSLETRLFKRIGDRRGGMTRHFCDRRNALASPQGIRGELSARPHRWMRQLDESCPFVDLELHEVSRAIGDRIVFTQQRQKPPADIRKGPAKQHCKMGAQETLSSSYGRTDSISRLPRQLFYVLSCR